MTVGMMEGLEDQLWSVLAQLDYTHTIRRWDKQGVPFCTHAYVPEKDPVTGNRFHEREDHAHLLKVYNKLTHVKQNVIASCNNTFTENCDCN